MQIENITEPIKGARYHCRDCRIDLCQKCSDYVVKNKTTIIFKANKKIHRLDHPVVRVIANLDNLSARHFLYTYCTAKEYLDFAPGHENNVYSELLKIDTWEKLNNRIVSFERTITLNSKSFSKSIEEFIYKNRKAIFKNFDLKVLIDPVLEKQSIKLDNEAKNYQENLCQKSTFSDNGYLSIDLSYKLLLQTWRSNKNIEVTQNEDLEDLLDPKTHCSISFLLGRNKDFELVLMKPKMKMLFDLLDESYDFKDFMTEINEEKRNLYIVLISLIKFKKNKNSNMNLYEILSKQRYSTSNQKYLQDLLEFIILDESKLYIIKIIHNLNRNNFGLFRKCI